MAGHGETTSLALRGGRTYDEIAAGSSHTLARRSDGSVIAFGQNTMGCCNVPALPAGMSYVQIAAGTAFSFVLRGYVRHWLGNVWAEFDRVKLIDLVAADLQRKGAARQATPAA